MRKILLIIVSLLFCGTISSQIAKNKEDFTAVSEIDNRVVFLREIATNSDASKIDPYVALKNWVKLNFGSDHFNTSIRYDDENKEIIVQSRVELILPLTKAGVQEKMLMKYRLSGFIFQNKCVLEISDIAYMDQGNKKNRQRMAKVVYAGGMISDSALEIDDEFKELRKLTKMSTLYFLNTFSKDLENQF